jgi:hypothetical protein
MELVLARNNYGPNSDDPHRLARFSPRGVDKKCLSPARRNPTRPSFVEKLDLFDQNQPIAMVTHTRTFIRLGFFSVLGIAFYYSHLFLGLVANDTVAMLMAVSFLLGDGALADNRCRQPQVISKSGKTRHASFGHGQHAVIDAQLPYDLPLCADPAWKRRFLS